MLCKFTVLLEESYASRNVSAYIPELRLNVVGDTEKEVLDAAQDLVMIELEKNPTLVVFSTKVVTLEVPSHQSI